ncbi:MAG: Panacea domain-containing protein [Alistipes sp.]|nr:Panacea domain-containing protein [Alistipes sp.]
MERIEDAAKYLIQLYNETGYECNRQKLQKLIIFAHLKCLSENRKGFTEKNFISVSPLGLGIEIIANRYYNFIIGNINNTEIITIKSEPDNETFLPEYQYNDCLLDDDYRCVLKEIFSKYGAYSGQELCDWTRKTNLWKNNINNVVGAVKYIIPSVDVSEFTKSIDDFDSFMHSLKEECNK